MRTFAAAEAELGSSPLRAKVKVARAQKRSCAERRVVSWGWRRVERTKSYRSESTAGENSARNWTMEMIGRTQCLRTLLLLIERAQIRFFLGFESSHRRKTGIRVVDDQSELDRR